jgi:menaquinone-dependent protoporphyrinogen oxidase
MTVLVAFATSRGSTQGIAERLAADLGGREVPAEARPVSASLNVAGYEAVILGSAVHGGRWLPEAKRFAAENAELLEQRPVWLFSVSTVGDHESMFPARVAQRLRAMRDEPEEVVALRAAIGPAEHRNFAGAVARTDWSASGRAFFRVMAGRYGDHRNWAAIDAWAGEIADELAMLPAVRVVQSPR